MGLFFLFFRMDAALQLLQLVAWLHAVFASKTVIRANRKKAQILFIKYWVETILKVAGLTAKPHICEGTKNQSAIEFRLLYISPYNI